MGNTETYATIYIYPALQDWSPTGHVAVGIMVEGKEYMFEKQFSPKNLIDKTPGLGESEHNTSTPIGNSGLFSTGELDGRVGEPENPNRVPIAVVRVPLSAVGAQEALNFARDQVGVSGYAVTLDNCKTFVDEVLQAAGYKGDWTSLIEIGALNRYNPIKAVLDGYYDSVVEKIDTQFPGLIRKANQESVESGEVEPLLKYVLALVEGDPQAIARTAMELSGGRLNLGDGVAPQDVGNYPDLILRAAAGITTISGDDDDDEQSARELIEQIKDADMSPTAPEPVYRAPTPEIESGTGQSPDDPGYDGPQPILLDLDGNGIRITEQSRSGMFVDAGGDGLLHRTAWAGAGDGVLFYDPDGTGAITEKRQYVFTEWDPTATDDLAALRSVFDSNGDGVLNASDAAFASFKVMVSNADGSTTSWFF